jgi:hypothetical protein
MQILQDSDSRERHQKGLQRQQVLELKQKIPAEIAGKTLTAEKDTCRDSGNNRDSSFTTETQCRDVQGWQWQQRRPLAGTPVATGKPGLQQKFTAEIAGKTVTAEKYTCRETSFTKKTPCRDWREDSDSRGRHLQRPQHYGRNCLQRLQGRHWQAEKDTCRTPALQQKLHAQIAGGRQWQQRKTPAGTPALQQKLHAEIRGKTVTAEKYTCRDSSFTTETPCRDCWEYSITNHHAGTKMSYL